MAKDFITKEYPVLKKTDTGEYVMALMDDFKVRHLPLAEVNQYKCLINEKDVLSMHNLSDRIEEPSIAIPPIPAESHFLEALAAMTRYDLSLVPVVDTGDELLGVITLEKMAEALSTWTNADTPGSIIVLEVLPQDYALSDIARLAESNNAHILSLLTNPDPASGRLWVSLKVDLEDASALIRSFERFNYTILYHFMKQGVVKDILEQRMQELIRFMNI